MRQVSAAPGGPAAGGGEAGLPAWLVAAEVPPTPVTGTPACSLLTGHGHEAAMVPILPVQKQVLGGEVTALRSRGA